MQKCFPFHCKKVKNIRISHTDRNDPEERGIVVTVHPWETGRDNSPEWDAPGDPLDVSQVGQYTRRDTGHLDAKMRPTKLEYDRYLALVQFGRSTGWDQARIARESPFRVADVGMSMILLRANRDLLVLAELLGMADEADELRAMIARSEAGIEFLWDPDKQCWASRDMITRKPSGFVTNASFLSFYAGLRDADKDAATLAHFARIAAKVRFMVPSLDPEDPGFQMVRYWRGPVWAVVNWMIWTGLLVQGLGVVPSLIACGACYLLATLPPFFGSVWAGLDRAARATTGATGATGATGGATDAATVAR